MKGFKKALALLLVLVACLALTTQAFAAEYTVRAGSSIKVAMSQTGDGGMDGNVTVSGGATATYSSSEAGGVTSGGTFYLYNSGTKTVVATVSAPSSAKIGDVYTVTFTYNAYDGNGNDSGTNTVVKTVTVSDKDSSPDGVVGSTGEVDYSKLKEKIAEAEALNPNDYNQESWDALQKALENAKEALNSKSQAEVDDALQKLIDAINALVKVDYSALDKAIEDAKGLGKDNNLNSLWLTLMDALKQAEALRVNGDQAAVDALTEQINDLVKQILAASGDEFCNVKIHAVWPILFFISLAVNVVLVILVAKKSNRRKMNRRDSTPLVDYDISDDE